MLPKKKKKLRSFFYKAPPIYIRIIRGVLYAFVAWVVLSSIVGFHKVPTASMVPAIKKNDRVFSFKPAYGVRLPFFYSKDTGKTITWARPKRGDIVLVADPSESEPNGMLHLLVSPIRFLTLGFVDPLPRKYIVKRVVALPKESVQITNKQLYINGELFKDEWARHKDFRVLEKTVAPRDNLDVMIVPFNSYYLLGDNRDYNYDSRNFGAVHLSKIRGVVLK